MEVLYRAAAEEAATNSTAEGLLAETRIRLSSGELMQAEHHEVARDDDAKPPRPEYKRVWASVETDLRAMIEQMFDEAERRDPGRMKTWLCVIDGDDKLLRAARKEAKTRGLKISFVLDFIPDQ